MNKSIDAALVWFRRDLRCNDHAALSQALRAARRVWCVFVFDAALLDPLPRTDRRVGFIRDSLIELDAGLRAMGGGLLVRHGQAAAQIAELAHALGVQAVYANHDYEPDARRRDALVRGRLAERGVDLRTFKDQVVFEASELMTAAGTPFRVFTAYKNAWLRRLAHSDLAEHPVQPHASALAPIPAALDRAMPTLPELGFAPHPASLEPGAVAAQVLLRDFMMRIDAYALARDQPALKGPSYLSVHLRFGTVSVRQLARMAHDRATAASRGAQTWLSELIWRDFFHQILFHHPHVVDEAFQVRCRALAWEKGPRARALFKRWCDGLTGYPLVDAGMAQLNLTGYMHNRLRMVTASFLTKDLGIDWRWGERYFAEKLNDYDLAANNGGWQWAASTGCDAQPYFRVFNPVQQSRKFDALGKFIRRYVPQLAALDDTMIHAPWEAPSTALEAAGIALGRDYPLPIVDHAEGRRRTLERFAQARA